jgi:hypothetical protein
MKSTEQWWTTVAQQCAAKVMPILHQSPPYRLQQFVQSCSSSLWVRDPSEHGSVRLLRTAASMKLQSDQMIVAFPMIGEDTMHVFRWPQGRGRGLHLLTSQTMLDVYTA